MPCFRRKALSPGGAPAGPGRWISGQGTAGSLETPSKHIFLVALVDTSSY